MGGVAEARFFAPVTRVPHLYGASGDRCLVPSCRAILSQYNPHAVCESCVERRRAFPGSQPLPRRDLRT